MTATLWRWARPVGGAAVLVVLVARLGAGPFVDALRVTTPAALVAATLVAAVATVACAWRWVLVSRGLGIPLGLRSAVPAYYRSMLVNATLPGGVLGDLHRGVGQGRRAGTPGRGLRAVAWERALGQTVQLTLTLAVLLALPSPFGGTARVTTAGLVVVAVLGAALLRAGVGHRARQVLVGDARQILGGHRAAYGVLLTSLAALASHAVVFVLALRATGQLPPARLVLPLTLVVLAGSAIPVNVAGWGPREGVAGWAFALCGLGATRGVTTAAVYGVLVLAGTLPGLLPTRWQPAAGVERGRGVRAAGAPARRLHLQGGHHG